ncbi:LysR family transcriptional regulator [Shewanella sp. VB17]|uniref:LysR family transcriptional regulator n=1 Tax=Shewanella sp. VB17 TaxID=2739432 RepID=UPI0015671D8E|nr:LysR family transcriptional regulator [Shewanella sp. VB17]NRD75795.1 LysR family transcriptional regulator [Shewanella sp. VB17]
MSTSEQAFLHVVETGSFKQAAKLLNMEPSSLSRKIAALEERLKIKLLHRSTSRTHPTELGQAYYIGLKRIIDEQMALEEEILSGVTTIKGKLRIGSTFDLAEKLITPVVLDMQREAPELKVELILSSDIDNLAEKNLDVAIRIGPLPDSNLIVKKVGEISRVLVANPEYVNQYGLPQSPSDLVNHNFVLYSAAQGRSSIEFKDGSVFRHSNMSSNMAVNSLNAIRYLVINGSGVNLGPAWLYEDDLKKGKLIRLLPSHPVKGFMVNAVYTERRFLPKKTKEFIEQLTKKISDITV